MFNESSGCAICKSTDVKDWGSEYQKCNFCGVCFRSPMPSLEKLEELYSNYYSEDNISNDKTSMGSGEVSLQNHAEFITRNISPEAKILDFGAGTGKLSKILEDLGFDVDGCEFSKSARVDAKLNYGFDFYSSMEEINKKYDLIIAVEVVEHLLDPQKTINFLYGLLNDSGLLYITTPNTDGLQSRINKSKWKEAVKPFHLMLFNKKSLVEVMNIAGFTNVRSIRFSPLTTNSSKRFLHRVLQFFGLYGGLRVLCKR